MESEILNQLRLMGKISDKDINEVLQRIPSKIETTIIAEIAGYYSDNDKIEDNELEIWISHFLPILKEESFKCVEKVRAMDCSVVHEPPSMDYQRSTLDA